MTILPLILSSVITVGAPKGPTSPDLWGIFFEDINLSLDGGIYAEMVRNPSFEDGNGKYFELPLAHWDPIGNAEYCIDSSKPLTRKNRHCVKVSGPSLSGVANHGFFGYGLKKGSKYTLSVALRCDAGDWDEGNVIEVTLEAYSKPVLAKAEISGVTSEWKTFNLTLEPNDTEPQARLAFRSRKGGTFYMDCVSMFPDDAVCGLFRKDLVEKLAALKPSFMRFPGGCWVEGDVMKEAYRWKQTIGERWDRRTQWNRWKYWSSNSVGFHEYLLLAEVLGAKPLYCINVGMSHKETVPMDKMDEYVQDALDCIEYANGPVDSEWGSKRAAAGHPKPFNLEYLEIGNENGGKEYEERYALMANAVRKKYPNVKLIFNNWKSTKRVDDPKELRDDHFYEAPDRFMGALSHEYDTRKGDFDIFVGEYAVTKMTTRYGSLRGAIGEAAFMLGLERNQDQVKLAAYAPLFANAQHTTWAPNLIYPMTDGCFVNPSWTVQKLFSENRGAEVLDVKVETDTFETYCPKAWGGGRHHNVIEKVQASAVRSANGSVIVKVVNCTEEPQKIELKGVSVGGAAEKIVFTGPDRDAHNTPFDREALSETTDRISSFSGVDTLPPLSLVIYRIKQ